jgi:anti-sigma B factor antagonist
MREENGDYIFTLEGKLDTNSSRDFLKEVESILPSAKSLTLDIKKVDYISSAGLGTILAAQQYMEEADRPDVKVININEIVKDIFMMTGFHDLVDAEM